MTTKKQIERVDRQWQKKAKSEGKPLVIVKCDSGRKVERVRGIQI